MKKFLCLVTALIVMIGASMATVSAAATEQDILTALSTAKIPDVYYQQAVSYMKADGVDLTEAQITGIVGYINHSAGIAKGETDAAKLTGDQRAQIAKDVEAAAKLLGLKTTYSSTTGLSIVDTSNKVLVSASSRGAVQKTGFDYQMVAWGLGIMVLAGVSGIVIKTRSSRKAAQAA